MPAVPFFFSCLGIASFDTFTLLQSALLTFWRNPTQHVTEPEIASRLCCWRVSQPATFPSWTLMGRSITSQFSEVLSETKKSKQHEDLFETFTRWYHICYHFGGSIWYQCWGPVVTCKRLPCCGTYAILMVLLKFFHEDHGLTITKSLQEWQPALVHREPLLSAEVPFGELQ